MCDFYLAGSAAAPRQDTLVVFQLQLHTRGCRAADRTTSSRGRMPIGPVHLACKRTPPIQTDRRNDRSPLIICVQARRVGTV